MPALHFDITADNTNISSVLQATTEKMKKMASLFEGLGDKIDFSDSEKAMASLRDNIKNATADIAKYIGEIGELTEKQRQASIAGDTDAIEEYGKQLEEVGKDLQELTVKTQGYSNALDFLRNSLDPSNLTGYAAEVHHAQEQIADAAHTLEALGMTDSSVDLSNTKNQIKALADAIEENERQIREFEKTKAALQKDQGEAISSGDFARVDSDRDAIVKTANAIQQLRDENEKYANTLQIIKSGTDSVNNAAKNSTSIFGSLSKTLLKGVSIAGLVTTAIGAIKKVATDSISLTQRVGDTWNREVSGWKNAYESFVSSIGSGKGFREMVNGMSEAYLAGKKLYDLLDELFEMNNSLIIKESEYNQVIEENRQIMMDSTRPYTEREEAAQTIIEKEKELGEERKRIAQQELDANTMILEQRTGMSEADREFFIKGYNDNQELIQQAIEYRQALVDVEKEEKAIKNARSITAGGAAYSKMAADAAEEHRQKLEKLREVINNVNQDAVAAYNVLQKYNEGNDEIVEKWVASYVKVNNATTDVSRNTRRAETTLSQMRRQRELEAVEDASNKRLTQIKKERAEGVISEEEYQSKLTAARKQGLLERIALEKRYGQSTTSLEMQLADEDINASNIANQRLSAEKTRQDELNALVLSNSEKRIELMEDGEEKQLAQIEASYDKMLEGIRKKRTAWENESKKNGLGGVLTDEQEAALKEAEDLAGRLRDKQTSDYYEQIIKSFEGYLQKRERLVKGYKEKEDALYAKDEQGQFITDADGNRVFREGATQANADELARQRDEALKAVDAEFAQREETYQSWLDSIANISLAKLRAMLEEAEEELARLEAENPDDAKGLAAARAKVNTLTDKITKTEAEDAVSPGKRTLKEWEDLYKTLSDVNKEFDNIGDTVGGTAGDIIKAASTVVSSTLSMISGITQLTTASATAMQGTATTSATALSTVEKASVILAIISAAMSIATTIINLFKRTDHFEVFRKEVAELNHQLELLKLNERIGKESGSIFGEDALERARSSAEAATEALGLYNKTIGDITSRKYRIGGLTLPTQEFDNFADAIARMQVEVRHSTWFRSAKYESLKDAVPELFNTDGSINRTALNEFIGSDTFARLSEENQKYLQNMADSWEAYENAVSDVKDYLSNLFGDMSDNLADATIEGLRNGTDVGVSYLKDNMLDAMDDMEHDLVARAYNQYLAQYQDRMMEIITSGGDESDMAALYAEMFDGMGGVIDRATTAAEMFEQQAKENGYDMDKLKGTTEDRNVTAGGFQTMSQDTGTELNGRFTALQLTGESIAAQMLSGVSLLTGLRDNAVAGNTTLMEIRNFHMAEVGHLEDISKHTKQMLEIREDIAEIRKNTKGLL